ncbi:acetyl-CoA C-acyltransferase [Corynebacterium striatum]|uniref:acetyl-CoA C-acyltransferase n=1 Tax=Corynebacterium striatum TaxID=43770 RepID=UPI001419A275|nr:acetyl-CoA C-acyltransferase [Corynebacterium striatum]NHY11234.1 acetyl-CoA C-acyltransferase [Corynebacterium striatum]NHY35571.1 acetyl-CoA C-acyltransferase [Corynebacterium striatum]HAT1132654.1 acetyl-CoA C-acyltransferase [Corynebacterium striatum]HAT1140117.1 acetyl-CoA C-acyltransferase [Corynebacterium striatum]HAT1142462.1 acetyl-CoA C-acyltransferase [Corynebacterium striatum]
MAQDVYIVGAARLPIGKFGGSLARLSLTELGTTAASAAIERSGIPAAEIDTAVASNVIPVIPSDLYISRKVAIGVGMPESSTAMGVNRLCGSGVQAVVSAAQLLQSGDGTVALAIGAESMSQAPYSVEGARFGKRMGDGKLYDWLTGALSCPFGTGHMGVTAENVASDHNISRERQDEFSAQSQRRAAAARAEGVHAEEIVAVGDLDFDEHVRETSVDKLAQLKPAFAKDGTVTPGNASGINDGAAAVVLATAEQVSTRNLEPLAKIVSWAIAGVDPTRMGVGPIAAVPKALEKAGLTLNDIDLIESNEAFAAQAIAVQDELGFDPEKTNIYGGAVAHGHPVGATGVILITKLAYALRRLNKRYGLVTMCIGGGQGIALIIENESENEGAK